MQEELVRFGVLNVIHNTTPIGQKEKKMKKLSQSLFKSFLSLFVDQTEDIENQQMDPSGYIKCCGISIFAGGRGLVECSTCGKKYYAHF